MSKNIWNVDRFDLEQALSNIANMQEDIQCVAEMIYDSELIYDPDRTHTVLMGLAELLAAKSHKAEIVFQKLFQLNDYCVDEEALKYRTRMDAALNILEEE